MAEVEPIPDESTETFGYHLVLVPRYGETVLRYTTSLDEFMALVQDYLIKLEKGLWQGEVHAFRGVRMDYTNAVHTMQVKIPGLGHFEIRPDHKMAFCAPRSFDEDLQQIAAGEPAQLPPPSDTPTDDKETPENEEGEANEQD